MTDITTVVPLPVSAPPWGATFHTHSPEGLGEGGPGPSHIGRNQPWQCGGGGDGDSGHSTCTSSAPRASTGITGEGQGRSLMGHCLLRAEDGPQAGTKDARKKKKIMHSSRARPTFTTPGAGFSNNLH